MTFEEKLNFITTYINNNSKQNRNYSTFYELYPFSTENLTFFNEDMLKDKDILLTGSSADQILTAHLFGSKTITCFDINPFINEMLNLKIAAIKELNLDEFINFFFHYSPNESSYDYKTYLKLRKHLKDESLIFWDTLYSKFSSTRIRNKFFKTESLELESDTYKETIPYLNENNYIKLKEKLNKDINIDFIETDILQLPTKLTKNYDVIYFSNIFARVEMEHIYGKHYIKTLYKFMSEILKHTNEKGIILLNYYYNMPKEDFINSKGWTYNVRFPIKCFKCENKISYLEVKSVSELPIATKDTVLVYKK